MALIRINNTHTISRLIGPGSINERPAWNVAGADLGHTFLHGGRMYVVFGDTFGPEGSDWRSNTMAWMEPPPDPRNGLTFAGVISDASTGRARELLSSKKVLGEEQTVIPTYGVSVGGRMFLHYMSVREFTTPGRWTLNHSGMAYSDDDGRSWTKDPNTTWPSGSNFGQVSIAQDGSYLYFFGIPGGRFGSVQLARVPCDSVLRKQAYRYWTGESWTAGDGAIAIVPAPVGELSVRWNSFYEKWLMMYLNEERRAIVLRSAERPTGPWSEEQAVTTADRHPQLYAPYITPLWNDGPDVFFTMSLFDPYSVYLMHAESNRSED